MTNQTAIGINVKTLEKLKKLKGDIFNHDEVVSHLLGLAGIETHKDFLKSVTENGGILR